jgi:transposase InsO family protein
MQRAKIRSKVKRKFVATTDSKHTHPVAENLLNRQFEPGQTDQIWVSDLTYIRTAEGWLYLTVIIDLCCRKVIGWALSKSLDAESTCVAAWKMAVGQQPPQPGLIFHSDRGIQYACTEFRQLLNQHKVQQSMSRRANCWDNAVAESFFKSLKVEWLYGNRFASRVQAQLAVFEYIETWYNTRRRHSALGYMTPTEFEHLMSNKKIFAPS